MFSRFDAIPACDRQASCDTVVRATHTHRTVLRCKSRVTVSRSRCVLQTVPCLMANLLYSLLTVPLFASNEQRET